MQATIYYSDEDGYLIKQADMKGQRERKSRSAVILSILEELSLIHISEPTRPY